jgi:hypothetical protein
MIKQLILFGLLLCAGFAFSQEFKVEYDKDHDFSQYKTFSFGEGEFTTPKDEQQISAAQADAWIKDSMTRELELKGLQRVDSAADLVVTYLAGTLARSEVGNVGPMGLTPGSMERNYSRDYRVGNLVIDLNNKKGIMVWRVNATIEMLVSSSQGVIEGAVQKGFKKYPKPAKKKKK